MNKIIIAAIALAVIATGTYFLRKNRLMPTIETGVQTPAAEENLITYSDAGFSPNVLKVRLGTMVIFKNSSQKSMWPASAMHPTHKAYPTTGGCLGSTFDACKGILPGDSWSFIFDIAGSWKYHNHLNPGQFGTIAVE